MPFGSRAKGAKAELEVAAMFARWWAEVEPGCIFKRCPLSGGWGDKDARAGFNASGDLVTTAELWPWVTEVKRREKGWTWKNVLAGRPTAIWAWWRQAQQAADEMQKEPLLIFRKNREDWRVLLPLDYLERCGLVSSTGNDIEWQLPWPGDGSGDIGGGFAEFAAHWTMTALRGVDYGSRLPVCLDWEDMATVPPRAFILPARTGIRATGTRR